MTPLRSRGVTPCGPAGRLSRTGRVRVHSAPILRSARDAAVPGIARRRRRSSSCTARCRCGAARGSHFLQSWFLHRTGAVIIGQCEIPLSQERCAPCAWRWQPPSPSSCSIQCIERWFCASTTMTATIICATRVHSWAIYRPSTRKCGRRSFRLSNCLRPRSRFSPPQLPPSALIAPHLTSAALSILTVLSIFWVFRRPLGVTLALLGTLLFVGTRYFVHYGAFAMADLASAGWTAATFVFTRAPEQPSLPPMS